MGRAESWRYESIKPTGNFYLREKRDSGKQKDNVGYEG